MNRLGLAAAAAAVSMLPLLGVGGQAKAADVTLRMQTFIPPVANPSKHFLIPWAKKIGEASGGKLKVQPFWAMQLGGKAPQLLDQVRDGVVDIGWTLPGFTPGRMPRLEPFELPFVHKDALSSTLALQDYQEKHLLDTDLKDYKALLLHVHQGFLFQTKKPIRAMADLRGLKIRAASRGGVWLLEALGATGMGMPLPRIPPALSKGVIDGVTLPYEIAPSVKTQDLVSHFSKLSGPQPRLGTNVFTFLMNKASYNKLPKELKKVIDDNSGHQHRARQPAQNWRRYRGARVARSSKSHARRTNSMYHRARRAETAKMKAAAEAGVRRAGIAEDEAHPASMVPALVSDARAH